MKRNSRLFMETTRISAKRSAAQISTLLGEAGARAVLQEFGDGGTVEAICFQIRVGDSDLPFRLPVRVAVLLDKLTERRQRIRDPGALEEQAERIAWRQAYRWVQAQVAFCDTGMVKMVEVFMPYMEVSRTQTLFDKFEAGSLTKLLSDGRRQSPTKRESDHAF